MRGAHYGEIAKSPGGFFFVWTLWALGGLGGFTFILSVRGLWSLRSLLSALLCGRRRTKDVSTVLVRNGEEMAAFHLSLATN